MAKRESEHKKAFEKYDLHGEDLAHRIIAGEVKASPTEQAYAMLWLAEHGHRRIKEMESTSAPGTEHALELAKAAARSHHLAARAALHSAESQRRAAGSALRLTRFCGDRRSCRQSSITFHSLRR